MRNGAIGAKRSQRLVYKALYWNGIILVCCRETGISNISFCEIVEILGLSRITRGQLEIPQSFQTLEKSLNNKYTH